MQKLGGPPIFFCIEGQFFFKELTIPPGGDDACDEGHVVLLQHAMHCHPLRVVVPSTLRLLELAEGMTLRSEDLLVGLDGLLHMVAILLRAYFTFRRKNESSL